MCLCFLTREEETVSMLVTIPVNMNYDANQASQLADSFAMLALPFPSGQLTCVNQVKLNKKIHLTNINVTRFVLFLPHVTQFK